jgi:hypothetical protein
VLEELAAACVTDADIHKITWQDVSRFLNWDPFTTIPRPQATDVDLTIRPRKEWADLYAQRTA